MKLFKTPEETVSEVVKNLSLTEAAEYIATCFYIANRECFHLVLRRQVVTEANYLQHKFGTLFYRDVDTEALFLAADKKVQEGYRIK